MESNRYQFHPDVNHERNYTNEPNEESLEKQIFQSAPTPTQKKKKMNGVGRKLIACLLVVLLGGSAGFGGALLAINVSSGAMSQTAVGNAVSVKTDSNINTAEAIAEKVIPSVVGITAVSAQKQSQSLQDFFFSPSTQAESSVGTGLIFTADGHILTNSHVVLDGEATQVLVQLSDGREVEGKILWSDKSSDIAIVKIEEKNLTPAELGDSEEMKVGAYVVAIGNPLGLAFDRSATQGIISGLSRTIEVQSGNTITKMEGLLQTDASINSGNSGGPLCNSEGQVIGINTAKAQSGEGLGFAIPINIIKPIVEEIIETGEFERSYMGVTAISVGDILESYPNEDFGTKTGARIEQIYTDSPAAKAGLKEGDIVVGINDDKVETITEMIRILFSYRPGDEVSVKIIRDKKPMTIKVVLATMNEE